MTKIKLVLIAMLLGTLFASTACNTVRGVGEDVESGGEAIQDATK